MKNIENKAMLITYADSMGTNLKALERVLDKHFDGVFGGVHVLPFFPSSGDRGLPWSTTTLWTLLSAPGKTSTGWGRNIT